MPIEPNSTRTSQSRRSHFPQPSRPVSTTINGFIDIQQRTAHEVLGISTTANEADIRHAYKRRLLETHPDKPNGSRAAFDAVHEAYNQLTSTSLSTERKSGMSPPTVIVDTISLHEDMDICKEDDSASYPCRCGDFFILPMSDLSNSSSSTIVTCHGCSLSIIVEVEQPH